MEECRNIPWELIALYIRGELPESKLEEWNAFLRREPDFESRVEEMKAILPQLPRSRRLTPLELEKQYVALSSGFDNRKRVRKRVLAYVAGVAAVLLFAFLGIQWWSGGESQDRRSVDELAVQGRVQAELILASGQRVMLDPEMNPELRGAVLDSSGLVYPGNTGKGDKTEYNTLKVPKGGEFRLTLSDGTVVFLNSASELTYPTVFRGDSRTVSLAGEGYFDVTRSDVPFMVRTARQCIAVLGTEFNVSSYGEGSEESVVLVSGKVRLDGRGGKSYTLEPGERACLLPGVADYQVEKVNARFYTGWKEGVFYFNRMSLERIMEQLSRWYDVEIRFEDDGVKALHFSGAAERDKPLSFALEMIRATTAIDFEVDGGVIIIRKR